MIVVVSDISFRYIAARIAIHSIAVQSTLTEYSSIAKFLDISPTMAGKIHPCGL